jgi:hypothetical protein
MELDNLKSFYDEVFTLSVKRMTEGVTLLEVAAALSAISMRLYRTNMDDENFEQMMTAIYESRHRVESLVERPTRLQ